jgi:prepilin-type N-terminal cleavage/methylation domain-containing protein
MKTHSHQRGFSLIELAIAMLIVGLLLSGGLSLLGTQLAQQRVKETQRLLDDAREALTGFAIIHGRLPCPALATTATGAASAGLEPSPPLASGCTHPAGVLPWATLGVAETDAWGHRYTYRVSQEFTRTVAQSQFAGCAPPTAPTQTAFALCSQGELTLVNTVSGNSLSSTVPAVIVSHGQNGLGSYTSDGKQLATGTDADELNNQLVGGVTTSSTGFVSKAPSSTFDDMVVWLSSNILYNRMVQAGKLP